MFFERWKNADSREQRRIAIAHSLEVQMLFHIHVEDFITYPWTPETQFLEFIWCFESKNTETMP